ncbi:alpha/beta hydrolase [Ruficoccus sp. ZRK36]|uniref:alpha/beta hydrolase n=1 Tax=Ruficoccus sp. ZRK36 TaxID=2866311 RepID=UPI001C72D07B|nr:alpha/beta hydrolase [Ruficoccus sp. ZRK36]QYY36404.1 alpha/beta hydrolase [Ruficoccus sp. ZRK36]
MDLPPPPPPPPADYDVRYSDNYERSLLDIWLPESDEPTPVFIFFHGGGFKRGDKNGGIGKTRLSLMMDRGVAVVSVEYPVIGDAHQETGETIPDLDHRGYVPIAQEAELAVDFLIEHAAEYNIDPEQIVLCGSSAGALIVEYLSYGTDLPIAACLAIAQPYRFDEYEDLFHGRPIPLTLFSHADYEDIVHHPRYTELMAERCRELGIPVTVFGDSNNDLPKLPAGTDLFVYVYDQLMAAPAGQ